LTLNADGTFSYDPNGQFENLNDGDIATDSFTYTIGDSSGGTDSATVNITVDGVTDNGAPDAIDDEFLVDEDTLLSSSVFADNSNGADTDPDGDSFTVTAVNGIAADVGNLVTLTSGALLTLNADGTFSYDPNGQFENLNDGDIATDSFTYTIGDSSGGTDSATVNIIVDGVTDNSVPDTSFWFSPNRDSSVGKAEDIIFFDGNGSFSTFFDGSTVGLDTNIDAFDIISDTVILMSFSQDMILEGVGYVDDSDIVKLTAESLGENVTAGSFELYLDGSDLGLTKRSEDIDALTGLADGSLLFSTVGNSVTTGGLKSKDEDLVRFDPISGEISLYFDGSDVGLTKRDEDVKAVGMIEGDLLLSTQGNFGVDGLTGKDEDVFSFMSTAIGEQTSGTFGNNLFFDGSEFGFGGDISALDFNIV
ncbi:MAG: hypothetical protein F6K19_32860, partial [Cyanothece sp. SIO1E1]|nr:hypothetical protein [Cyanothece sp. SIO1E1]